MLYTQEKAHPNPNHPPTLHRTLQPTDTALAKHRLHTSLPARAMKTIKELKRKKIDLILELCNYGFVFNTEFLKSNVHFSPIYFTLSPSIEIHIVYNNITPGYLGPVLDFTISFWNVVFQGFFVQVKLIHLNQILKQDQEQNDYSYSVGMLCGSDDDGDDYGIN